MERFETGTCRFCGQVIAVEASGSREEADALAVQECDCADAAHARQLQRRIDRAKERVRQLFGEQCAELDMKPVGDETVMAFLEESVYMVATGKAATVKVDLGEYGAASIQGGVTKKMRVKRTEIKARQLEE